MTSDAMKVVELVGTDIVELSYIGLYAYFAHLTAKVIEGQGRPLFQRRPAGPEATWCTDMPVDQPAGRPAADPADRVRYSDPDDRDR